MCFSAVASFTVAAALLPAGGICVANARKLGRKYLPIALFPVFFGAQQAVEGIVWLGMNSGNSALVCGGASGFQFFAYFFWLAWVPFAILCLESEPVRRRILWGFTMLGTVFGLSLFVPILFHFCDNWLSVAPHPVNGTLEYRTRTIYEGFTSRGTLDVVYGVVIMGALMMSSLRWIQIFGVLVFLSALIAWLLFAQSFISVWCFFGAVISTYFVGVFLMLRRSQ